MNPRPTIAPWLCLFVFTPALFAQPAAPQLTGLSLNTHQRGQAVEVVVFGVGLAGVKVEVPNPGGVAAELVSVEGNSAKVKLTIGPEATLGPRELRVVGPTGASNPLTFHVSQFQSVVDTEPNDGQRQPPQDTALPAVLVGAMNTPGDADVYRFQARKGEKFIAEVRAAREGSMLDAVLTLHNPAGREVASNNDRFGLDPFLVYEIPADGAYMLTVRDLRFRGGDAFTYRMNAGPIPYLEAVYPISGTRGQSVEVQPVGYNLPADAKVSLNLADAAETVPVQVPVGGTSSNPKSLDVVAVPTAAEAEPNDAPDKANVVAVPISVNGRIERPGDKDTFRFTLDKPMKIAAEAYAARYGSKVDPLLTLLDAAGKVIVRNDDAGPNQFDAKLVADLQPGTYSVTIEDLLYSGGPANVYRLSIGPDTPPPQNFVVRFMPDTPRIARGGHSRVWCEVVRVNGYGPDVEVSFEGLPEGVTLDPAPVNIGQATSGIFTLAAAPTAKTGTFPIKLIAKGTLGDGAATRTGQPQAANTVVQQAYITVFEPAPFTVRAIDLTPDQVAIFAGELDAVEKKLLTPTPELHAAAAEWEKSLGQGLAWITLDTLEAKSAQGATLVPQTDGSILATGANPAADTYTVTTQTELKGITAVKLEVFADDAFPARGPGRAANGNFVLSTISLQATSVADANQTAAVAFASAFADFSQATLTPDKSFDADNKLGWAILPAFGKDHFAVFQPAQPVAGYEGGTKLVFTMLQDFGGQHTIGRIRLSATTAPQPAAGPTLPKPVAQVVMLPADQRTPQQKDILTAYYMTFAPQLEPDRQRLALLRSIVGPAREVAQLDAQLNGDNPQADAAQQQWEQAVTQGAAPVFGSWHLVGPFEARAEFIQAFNEPFPPETQIKAGKIKLDEPYPGATMLKWAERADLVDGQVHTLGNTARSAIYLYRTVTVAVPLALNLSLGSDDGIKVFVNGQEVLANPAQRGPAPDQDKAVAQLKPGENTILLKIVNGESGTGFYFKAAEGVSVPENILAAVKLPADQRTPEHKKLLRDYYRSIDPTLKPVRDRVASLRKQLGTAFPPVAKRKEMLPLSVAIQPAPGFDGPVTVTLEGYSSGRDPAGNPTPIAVHIDTKPLTLSSSNALGILSLTPKDMAELGTKNVVLRAEAKVAGVTWVQYSPAFTLTVKE